MYLIVLLIQFHAAVMNKFWNTAYLTLIPCVDRKWRVVQFCFSSGRSRNANIFSQLCCNCCSLSDAYLLKYLGCLDEFLMSLLPCCIIFSTEIVQFCIWVVVIQYTVIERIYILYLHILTCQCIKVGIGCLNHAVFFTYFFMYINSWHPTPYQAKPTYHTKP